MSTVPVPALDVKRPSRSLDVKSVFDRSPLIQQTAASAPLTARQVAEEDLPIIERLDLLWSFREEIKRAEEEFAEQKLSMISDDVRQQWKEMDAEFNAKLTAADENLVLLENEIDALTLAAGHRVDGSKLKAVYRKPGTKWDKEELDGYAATHEEIRQFCHATEASIAITEVVEPKAKSSSRRKK